MKILQCFGFKQYSQDREVTANRTGIIIKNKNGKHVYCRFGKPRTQKCCAKGSGKELKYKSFCTEVKGIWNLNCMIIPVVTGATGIVTKDGRKYLKATPG
jgi:hypothetical protein